MRGLLCETQKKEFGCSGRGRSSFSEGETEGLRRASEPSVLCCFFGLVGVIRQLAGQVSDVAGNSYTGSSLLSGRAGGYVLMAVVAFWAGVLVAVLIREYRRRTHKNECGGSGK